MHGIQLWLLISFDVYFKSLRNSVNLTSTFLVALSVKLIVCYLQHNWTMKTRHPIYRNYWVGDSVILPINNIWLYMSIQYLPLFKVWRAGYVMIVYKLFVVFMLFGFNIKGNKTLWHITWTVRLSELVKQNAIVPNTSQRSQWHYCTLLLVNLARYWTKHLIELVLI